MRTLLFFLLCVQSLFGAGIHPLRNPAWLRSSGSSGGGTPARTWVLNETFEATGYDNTWTEVLSGDGVLNEDYTTTVLSGSQSLLLDCPSSDAARATNVWGTSLSTAYCYTMMRFSVFPSTGVVFYRLLDTSGNAICTLELTASTQVRIRVGSGTAACSDALSTGTTYHFWIRYTKGTGANAVGQFGFSTDGTKPTSGSKFCSTSSGTSTANAGRITIGATGNQTHSFIWDNIRVDSADIGNNGS